MPHVKIFHFPVEIEDSRRAEFVASLTALVESTFQVPPSVVSIASVPVEPADWKEAVVDVELENGPGPLWKSPGAPVDPAGESP